MTAGTNNKICQLLELQDAVKRQARLADRTWTFIHSVRTEEIADLGPVPVVFGYGCTYHLLL